MTMLNPSISISLSPEPSKHSSSLLLRPAPVPAQVSSVHTGAVDKSLSSPRNSTKQYGFQLSPMGTRGLKQLPRVQKAMAQSKDRRGAVRDSLLNLIGESRKISGRAAGAAPATRATGASAPLPSLDDSWLGLDFGCSFSENGDDTDDSSDKSIRSVRSLDGRGRYGRSSRGKNRPHRSKNNGKNNHNDNAIVKPLQPKRCISASAVVETRCDGGWANSELPIPADEEETQQHEHRGSIQSTTTTVDQRKASKNRRHKTKSSSSRSPKSSLSSRKKVTSSSSTSSQQVQSTQTQPPPPPPPSSTPPPPSSTYPVRVPLDRNNIGTGGGGSWGSLDIDMLDCEKRKMEVEQARLLR